MKHINHKTVFVSLLAFFLLVSFISPLKKTKKVEEKPIATILPTGDNKKTQLPVPLGSLKANSVVNNTSVIQNNSGADSVAKAEPIINGATKQTTYLKYDSTSSIYEEINTTFLSANDAKKILSFDPVSFKLSTNKASVNVGEEFEITITAKLLNVTPQMIFTFEGSNEFTLKLINPEGFVQTGGQVDLIKGKVTEKQPTIEYKIKGFFETPNNKNLFKLIRSYNEATNADIFELKDTLSIGFNTTFTSVLPQNTENSRQQVVISNSQTNICATNASASKTITVHPVPAIPGTSNRTLCAETEQITLSITPLSNHTLLWYGNASTGGVSSIQNAYHNPTTAGKTRYYASQKSNITGCESGRSESVVTVNAKPLPPQTPFPTSICQDATPVSLGFNSSNTGFTLKWYSQEIGGNPNTVLPISPPTNVAKTFTYYVTRVDDYTTCESNRAIYNFTVHPKPNATLTSNSPVSLGGTLNLNASPTGSQYSYVWEGPNGFAGNNSANTSRTNMTLLDTGTFTVWITNNTTNCVSTATTNVGLNGNGFIGNPNLKIGNSIQPIEGDFFNVSNFPLNLADNQLIEKNTNSSNYELIKDSTVVITQHKTDNNILSNQKNSSNKFLDIQNYSVTNGSPFIEVFGTREDLSLCGSSAVTLTARNCSGQITWCDGNVNIGSATTITVTPTATTTYYLKCESSTPTLSTTKTTLCNTETAVLSTTNCPSGSTVAYYKKNSGIWEDFATPSTTPAGVYSAKCNSLDVDALRSNEITITPSNTAPPAPTITADKTTICGTESATLTATNCTASNIKWSNNETGSLSIVVNTTGTYTATCSATCGTSTVTSSPSNGIAVAYSAICDCSTAVISSNAPGNRINERSTLTLSVPLIPNATYYWSGPNIPNGTILTQSTLTIPNVSLANAGLYDVTMNCSAKKFITIGVDDIDECAGSFDYFAYSLSPNGEVGVGDELGFISDGGSGATYEWTGPAGFYSLEQFPKIALATKANEGGYNVTITKIIQGTACSVTQGMVVKIGDCNFDAGPSFTETGSAFNLSVWSNKNLVGATFEWLKQQSNGSWQTVALYGNPSFTKTNENRGTYKLKVSYKGCFVEKTIKVDYIAPASYQGYMGSVTCEGITMWLQDNNNIDFSLNHTFRYKIDNNEWLYTFRNDGGQIYQHFTIPIPEQYKDGLPHTVTAYYPNSNTPFINSTNRTFQCCSGFVFDKTPIVSCTSASAGSMTVSIRRENPLMDRPVQYFLESQSKNEDGQNIYTNYSSNWETADSGGEYTFTGLPNGNYRIKAKELAPLDKGCLITTNAAINCQGAGCVAPLISIFPGDNFREGMGIVPKLYANAAANPAEQPANAQGGLKLNGKGSASMPNYNWMKGSFSIEATIFPSPEGNISVGDASDASMQRYLFTSWNGGVGTGNAGFYLSVGSNGINVIEVGDNLRRVAISYDGSLSGWTHVAVVYKNNIATLFVNGQAVGKSTVTPNNYNVVGPNSIGTDRDKGFIGNVYATRLWTTSLESQVVAQLKNNLDPVLATEPNVGFWIFDKQPVAGNVEDLSSHKRKIKLEGQAYMSIVDAPILAPNAPVFEWWLNGIKVGTGETYTPPLNKTVAGTYNYVVKYQKLDGSYCQTAKTLTITPAIYGSLSGCYTMLANGDQRPIYPKYTPNDGQYTILKGYGASEKQIWRFEHLGDQIYRINSAFFTDMALAAPGLLTLKDKRVNNSDQKWKANVYDAATLTYTFTPQNATNKRLGYFWGDTDPLVARTMSGADGVLEAFQLVPAACPLPAQECNASGLATIERWLQPALLGTNPNNNNINWSTLNAGQYIKDNPNRYSTNFPLANFNITNSTSNNYPNKPSTWPDGRWVQRITGYLCAPKNGDYTFLIKTDEWAQLWMSTDEDPRNKRLVAQCTDYAGGFYERPWEQMANVTLSKGRSYYFEVVMKDEINSMNVAIAWVRPDEVVPSSNWNNLQPMPMTYISAVPRDVTPRQLIVVADKTKAAPTENVTLTASGCDYGRVVWKAGTEVIQNLNASITTITRQGPGIYQAMCTGDYNVVQDWVTVKVDITTEVLPIIPAIPPVCANGSVTLSINNPQAGLSVRWLWLKTDQASIDTYNQFNSSGNIFVTHPSIFNSVNAATTTQIGPRTYWVQFYSSGGWTSPPKPVVVAPYFVPNIKATNNGPIESGGTLTLSTGELAGATYAWTGPNAFSSTLRSPSITNFEASMVGTYSLTIKAATSAGGCTATYTTVVDMANCDIYIKATNPAAANAETYQLPRKPNGAAGFDPLILKVLPLEGTANFSAYDVTWMLNGNPIPTGTAGISWVSGSPNGIAEPTLTTNQIGEYVAILSLKRNPATTCEARVNLNAIPCRTFNANLNCTLPVITAASQLATGIPLAAGDVFTAGDYKVTITEITSGSQTGYNGKGYVEQMKLIGLPVAKQVAVTLENTVVNDCYELAGGKVISEYDPNWGGVLDVDQAFSDSKKLVEDLGNIIDNIINWADKFDGAIEDQEAAAQYIDDLNELEGYVSGDEDYTSSDVNAIKSKIATMVSILSGVASRNPNARVAATLIDKPVTKKSANDIIAEIWRPILTIFCDKNTTAPYVFEDKAGIVPACIWQDANWFKNEKALGCGLVDGFYINVANKISNFRQFVDCIEDLVASAAGPDRDLKACRAIGEQIYGPIKMIYGVITNDETRTKTWNGLKQEAKKYGQIITCTGAYADPKLCNYLQGRIAGDFITDMALGSAGLKILDGTKQVLKVANMTKVVATIEKVENSFAQLSQSVSKFGNAQIKRVGNIPTLIVGSTNIAKYTNGVIEPLVEWTNDLSAQVKASLKNVKFKDGSNNTIIGDIDFCEICTSGSPNLKQASVNGCIYKIRKRISLKTFSIIRDFKTLGGTPLPSIGRAVKIENAYRFLAEDVKLAEYATKAVNAMTLGNNSQITLYIEKIASELFDIDGFKSIAKKDKNLLKYRGDNGFDDIAFSPDVDLNKPLSQISVGEIVVVEAKPRNPSITLGTINNSAPPPAEVSQMSPEWIEKTANELIKAGQASGNIRQQRLGQLLIEHNAKIQKAIVAVNKETGEIIVQKLN